jgi:hypothetical protein
VIDGSEFLRGLDLAQRVVRQAAERAMAQEGLDVLRDALFEEPTVPFKEGTLRASGSVIVASDEGEQLVATSEGMAPLGAGAEPSTPAKPPSGMGEPGSIVVLVGFNTPYAARLHEHPEFKFTEPGSGGKYLESKLIGRVAERMSRVAGRIRDALSAAGRR